tara:strand:+ start:406 stop:780 length:375 start_codon:yes stop_codon:yes gene_type:complete
MRFFVMLLLMTLSTYVIGHQWTPTYPTLKNSYVSGVLSTRMELFNARKEVLYYQIGVFDTDFKAVPFATSEKIIKIEHLDRRTVDIFIRNRDKSKAVYICSKSKLLAKGSATTSISSRICSKIK